MEDTVITEKKNRDWIQIKDLPDEERPREKLFKLGADKLSNTELIAILLGSGGVNSSALDLAARIIAMDQDGIAHFAVCLPEEFCKVKGVGKAKSAQLVAAVELGKRIFSRVPENRKRVNCSDDVAQLVMQEMRYLKKEVFRVVMLNVKNEIIAVEDTAIGGLSSAHVHPREVFSSAVKKGANSVVLVHNHPSGNPQPSQSDIMLTKRLEEAGKILGVEVADHIVIGNGIYRSIKSIMINGEVCEN